jgi:hypothetical protein
MFHSRALFVFVALALLPLPACGDGGTGGTGNAGDGGSDDGEGGSPSTSSSNGGDGSGGDPSTTTTNSTGGSTNVCTPSSGDLTCSSADSCECEDMGVTMPPEAACPTTVGNICSPGHNQCGCDLPMDTDYVAPDSTCIKYVDGDTWGVEGTSFSDIVTWEPAPNGQYLVKFRSLFGPEASYYRGMTLSGKTFSWNQANQMLENCGGTFSADCKSIDISCQDGTGTPTVGGTLVYIHE